MNAPLRVLFAVLATLAATGCSDDDDDRTIVYRVAGLERHAGLPFVAHLVDAPSGSPNALSQSDSVVDTQRSTVGASGVAEVTFTDAASGQHDVDWFVDGDGDGARTTSTDGSGETGWRDTVPRGGDATVERDAATVGSAAPGNDAGPQLGFPPTCKQEGCGPDVGCPQTVSASPQLKNECYLYNDFFLCCLVSPYPNG